MKPERSTSPTSAKRPAAPLQPDAPPLRQVSAARPAATTARRGSFPWRCRRGAGASSWSGGRANPTRGARGLPRHRGPAHLAGCGSRGRPWLRCSPRPARCPAPSSSARGRSPPGPAGACSGPAGCGEEPVPPALPRFPALAPRLPARSILGSAGGARQAALCGGRLRGIDRPGRGRRGRRRRRKERQREPVSLRTPPPPRNPPPSAAPRAHRPSAPGSPGSPGSPPPPQVGIGGRRRRRPRIFGAVSGAGGGGGGRGGRGKVGRGSPKMEPEPAAAAPCGLPARPSGDGGRRRGPGGSRGPGAWRWGARAAVGTTPPSWACVYCAILPSPRGWRLRGAAAGTG